MRCIFCKKDSSLSVTVEHVMPESLGNADHVLQKGIVCDQCNNYFGSKVEKLLLEQDYFKQTRLEMNILNKKGKLVTGSARLDRKTDQMPGPLQPNILLSRFLCKVALESLTLKCLHVNGSEQEIVDQPALDPLRNFARFGPGKISYWHYNMRFLYSPNAVFIDLDDKMHPPFELLHEWVFHLSEKNELFFIVAILGVEYAINMGFHKLDTYGVELQKRSGRSYLFNGETMQLPLTR